MSVLVVAGQMADWIGLWKLATYCHMSYVTYAFSALTLLVGRQEGGIWPVKTLRCWRGYLSGARCRLAYAQLMPLPLTISCSSKIQIGFTFLVPAHPGSPGKRAIKWVCVCVCVLLNISLFSFLHQLIVWHCSHLAAALWLLLTACRAASGWYLLAAGPTAANLLQQNVMVRRDRWTYIDPSLHAMQAVPTIGESNTHARTHARTFNDPLSGPTQVSRYTRKVKPIWILLKHSE